MQGTVYKSTGSWYTVRDEAGRMWNARIKGKLKIDDEISSTNPIAVGDEVFFDVEDDSVGTSIISQIHERRNYIVRVSPHNKSLKHIVASNLDLAVIVTSIAAPRTSTGFIDRFLITAEAYHIPAVIVVNKIDQHKAKQEAILHQWEEIYGDAGYKLFAVSALQPATIAPLAAAIQGKSTLFSGHSGVGKSTLINCLIPGFSLRTQVVSGWSGKGQHTTTFAEMFDNPAGGKVVDTPGVKEFGLMDFKKSELSQYFPEMRRALVGCKFNNCLHVNEPGCAVKKAVREHTISEERYLNYVLILESIEEEWK